MPSDEIIYSFKFSDESQEELAEIIDYYNHHPNPDNGKRFLVKVETVVELLQLWPEAGAELEGIPGVRGFSIPKYPYRLYYTVLDTELAIIGISIYGTRRDPANLAQTLRDRVSHLT
ncbi:MAG: type II toxin-antitoxin system RelE/ParE family toxin [Propionibacteriaceae bacterium]|jgi:plasmid stabilization system protein ParE|nr:type II toxin-antitoxin system RelE/ParE family toxin [Propionibacteriaceae bacterium]